MDRTRIQSAAQDVATAFLPGALFLMLGTLVAVPALRGGDLGRMLSSVSWRMMGLELALLAAGFGAARMLARLDGARGGCWRGRWSAPAAALGRRSAGTIPCPSGVGWTRATGTSPRARGAQRGLKRVRRVPRWR